MSTAQLGPVVCFSYLAAAKLWKVRHFPLANHGAEVMTVEQSIAADGPMTAAVLAALGIPTLLLCNDPGNDANGAKVRAWLRRYGVATSVNMASDRTTPQIVVVADDPGTRTWFPHLPGVSRIWPQLTCRPWLAPCSPISTAISSSRFRLYAPSGQPEQPACHSCSISAARRFHRRSSLSLRHVADVRNALFQHSGTEHRGVNALTELGIEYPITDWQAAWAAIQRRTIDAFNRLREEIQQFHEIEAE